MVYHLKPTPILLSALTAAFIQSDVIAQQVYKCGTIYSQIPCDKTAEMVKITRDSRTPTQTDFNGKELCKIAVPRLASLKDPDSAKVEFVSASESEVIRYAGEPIVARKYSVLMNAKNSYGAYTGAKAYSCYLSEDRTRILSVVSPPGS